MLTIPHVAPEVFSAHPTYLELDALRDADANPLDQTQELRNILLMASSWVDEFLDLGPGETIAAHTHVENTRMRPDRMGRLLLHPEQVPVTNLVSLSYGYTPTTMAALTDLSGVWIEKGRHIVVTQLGWSGAVTTLQFGPAAVGELLTQWTYTVGYPNTQLAAQAAQGASSLTVNDATGLAPGLSMRLWQPGVEQTVTIANSYTPGSTTVPINQTLTGLQPAGAQFSGFPIAIHNAVILVAMAMLEGYEDQDEMHAPGAKFSPSSSSGSSSAAAAGNIEQAEELLTPFVRVR